MFSRQTYPDGQGRVSSQKTLQRPPSQVAVSPASEGQSESVQGSTSFLHEGPFVHCGSQMLDMAVKRHSASASSHLKSQSHGG